jgi:hypothetical protein
VDDPGRRNGARPRICTGENHMHTDSDVTAVILIWALVGLAVLGYAFLSTLRQRDRARKAEGRRAESPADQILH